jgi:predicted metal-dependent phosphoesterase TrpH
MMGRARAAMTSAPADLHLHSTCSDGTLAPRALVALAREVGLRAIALTDHDTLDGLAEARGAADAAGIEFVSGVELTCDLDGRNIHLLGYLFDEGDRALAACLADTRRRREARGREMVERLAALGVHVPFDAVQREAGTSPVGRPHVARALVATGAVGSIDEVFRRFLADDGPAFVRADVVSSADAIAMIRAAGGAAVMAHPALYRGRRDFEMVERLAEQGMTGVEVWHPKHRAEETARLVALAARLGLIATGGSDFHGPPGRDVSPGAAGVALDVVAELTAACA